MDIQFPEEQFKNAMPDGYIPVWRRRFMICVAKGLIMHDRVSTAIAEPMSDNDVIKKQSAVIKNCPFCGFDIGTEFNYDSIDILYPVTREKTVWRMGCNESMGGCNASVLGGSPQKAIDNWNKRV